MFSNFETFDFGSEFEPLFEKRLSTASKNDLFLLSANPAAATLLLRNQTFINWKSFSANLNPNAIQYLIKHPYRINWSWLSSNGNSMAIELLKENPDKIDYEWLCVNPHPWAVKTISRMIEENSPFINWKLISKNVGCGKLLRQHIDNPRLRWDMISKNPGAVKILCRELKSKTPRVDFKYLSSNQHPKIIKYLHKNINKIYWRRLSSNEGATSLLKMFPYRVCWTWLSSNTLAMKWLEECSNNLSTGHMFGYMFRDPFVGALTNVYDNKPIKKSFSKCLQASVTEYNLLDNHKRLVILDAGIKDLIHHEYLLQKLKNWHQIKSSIQLDKILLEDETEDGLRLYSAYKSAKDKRRIVAHAYHWSHIEAASALNAYDIKVSKLTHRAQDKHFSMLDSIKMICVLTRYQQVLSRLESVYNVSKVSAIKKHLKSNGELAISILGSEPYEKFELLRQQRVVIAHATKWIQIVRSPVFGNMFHRSSKIKTMVDVYDEMNRLLAESSFNEAHQEYNEHQFTIVQSKRYKRLLI